MAESVVTLFAEKLCLLLAKEARLHLGVEEQVRQHRDKLRLIKSFLKDADEKRKKNERVEIWVSQIRDLAYDAEDVIDAFILKVERQQQRNSPRKFIHYPNQLITIYHVGKKIKKINGRIEKIFSDKSKYNIDILEAGPSSGPPTDAQTLKDRRAPIVEEVAVVGFQNDVEKLALHLIQGESCHLVISIVGMGGLGKTTLAKKVYNTINVKKHFDTCAWIYVSQEYHVNDLLQSIIKQVVIINEWQKEELGKMNEEELRNELLKSLQEKRYLVVVDDIWSKEAWDRIEVAFPNAMNSSRIMLTTRNRDVALHADPSIDPYDLHLLDEKESWELFSKKVFPLQNICPSELESLGKKIIAKCSGLPLAIVVLGGVLSVKVKTPHVWSKLLDSANWQLIQDSNSCLKILSLSYNDLPYYLKSCFLYFGLFAEDFEISADKLILLWVAEGFIQPRGKENMEDVAEDCLEELIQRSMVQATKRKSDGGVLTCRIHDLLRDLAISEGKQDRFLDAYGNNYSASTTRSRRLGIHPCDNEYPYHSDSNLNLHSLLFFTTSLEKDVKWKSFYGDIKLLRVLDLEGVQLDKLPEEIGEFILLKYLGLKFTRITRLPPCISNLSKLQTLDLTSSDIEGIPNTIWKMKQLRHLYWTNYHGFQCIYGEEHTNLIGDFPRDLLTLELPAGNWIDGRLGKLHNLRQLGVFEVPETLYADALSKAIGKLECLQSLTLVADDLKDVYWSSSNNYYFVRRPGCPITQLPLLPISHYQYLYQMKLHGHLQSLPQNPHDYFPPNLIELHLSQSHLVQESVVTLEKLSNLRVLFLEGEEAYTGKVIVCSTGGFARLQFLKLFYLYPLEEWRVEVGAMPSLKHLMIIECNSLKMVPDGLRHIATLRKIELLGMQYPFNARVQENGEDWDKIQHIPSITIK